MQASGTGAAKLRQHLHAAHLRHHPVQHDGVRLDGPGESDGVAPVGSSARYLLAGPLDPCPHQPPDVRRVIHDQHTHRPVLDPRGSQTAALRRIGAVRGPDTKTAGRGITSTLGQPAQVPAMLAEWGTGKWLLGEVSGAWVL
jgi:hypothetical protein